MKIFTILFLLLVLPVFASEYNVYRPNNYSPSKIEENERVLFILDFSNSMEEYLDGKRKVDLMIDTMKSILPNLDPTIWA